MQAGRNSVEFCAEDQLGFPHMADSDNAPNKSSKSLPHAAPAQLADDEQDWKAEYEGLVELLLANGPPPQHPEKADLMSQDRRAEPRYSFKEGAQVFAHLGPKAFQIINISIGGVAFYSDIYFEGGTKLLLSALGMIALDVEILSCEMEEVDEGLMEYRYRVRAKFGPRVNGYQVYVLAREMYLQQQGEGGTAALDPTPPPPAEK
jgi:hypothetical protein